MTKPTRDANINIPDGILKELLTPSEWRMLKNRWQIIQLLEEGLSIRQVAKQAKVGTDTVMRVARMVEKDSLRRSLSRAQSRDSRSTTPWIFGKSE